MYQKPKPKSRKKIFLVILIIIGLMFLIYAATKAATKNKVINSTIAVIPVKGVISFSSSGLLFQQSNAKNFTLANFCKVIFVSLNKDKLAEIEGFIKRVLNITFA